VSPLPSPIRHPLHPSARADARAQRCSVSAQDFCAGAFRDFAPAWRTCSPAARTVCPERGQHRRGCLARDVSEHGHPGVLGSAPPFPLVCCARALMDAYRASARCSNAARTYSGASIHHPPTRHVRFFSTLAPPSSPQSSPCLRARSRAHPARERFRAGSLRSRPPQTRFCAANGDRRRRVRAQYDRGALRRGRRMRDLGACSGRVDGAPSRALFREARALMRNAPVLRGDAAGMCLGRCMSTNL
jgi:hypothetical protein